MEHESNFNFKFPFSKLLYIMMHLVGNTNVIYHLFNTTSGKHEDIMWLVKTFKRWSILTDLGFEPIIFFVLYVIMYPLFDTMCVEKTKVLRDYKSVSIFLDHDFFFFYLGNIKQMWLKLLAHNNWYKRH